MKYSCLIIIVFSLFSCKTTKIDNKKIEFDFANPEYPPLETIKPKQNLEITIKNVNPYLYEISEKDTLIVYQKEQPPLFGQVFKVPELKSTPSDAPPSNPTVPEALPKDKASVKIAKDHESALDDQLSKFVSGYPGKEISVREILSLAKIADDINTLLSDCYSTIGELKSKADNYIMSKLATLDKNSLPIGIQTLIENISTGVRSDMNQYIVSGNDLKKKLQAILDEADTKMSLAAYKGIEKDIKEKISIVDKIIENSNKLLDKLTEFDNAKVGTAIEDVYNKIMTARVDTTFLIPTFHSTDEVIINIGIKKKKEVFCAKEIRSFPITAVVRGGVKIDFSTGIVFNIGSKGFFDQKYFYDSVFRKDNSYADSVSITRSKNQNIVIPSIGAFFHVYSRLLSPINYGGMVGASLGSDQRTYIHIGACLLIGKSDRLIIGGGVSIATAEILDGKYSEGQIIKRSLAPTDIPTEKATRMGGYVSISWNLNLIK